MISTIPMLSLSRASPFKLQEFITKESPVPFRRSQFSACDRLW